jgi:hypothetical protein
MPPITQRPSRVEAGEFFKVEDGKIRQIALQSLYPTGAQTGWEAAARYAEAGDRCSLALGTAESILTSGTPRNHG